MRMLRSRYGGKQNKPIHTAPDSRSEGEGCIPEEAVGADGSIKAEAAGDTRASAQNGRHTEEEKAGQSQEEGKSLYILLSKTGTLPSRFINFLSPMPYVHASLAFDANLSEMYSFARKRVHYPFYCGFISEDINKGVFARKKKTKCLVLRLPVTEEEYERVRQSMEGFKAHRRRYGYNYIGVFAAKFHLAFERKYAFFCTQFVDKVLQMSGINLFGKKSGLVTPEDYRTSERLEHMYEGSLVNYRSWLDAFYLSEEEKTIRRAEKQEIREQKKHQREQQIEQYREHREQQKELRHQQREERKDLRDQQKELRGQQRERQRELRDQQKIQQYELLRVQHRELKEKQDQIDQKQLERLERGQTSTLKGDKSDLITGT